MAQIGDVVFVGLALSADSFSAALAMGFRAHTPKDSLKFAFASSAAEAGAALAGALAGAKLLSQISAFDHWIAFGLLFAVAAHMAKEGLQEMRAQKGPGRGEEETFHQGTVHQKTFHSFKKILLVSFATSLDALGVGAGLGLAGRSLPPYIASIGFWAFMATLTGMFLAKKIPENLSPAFHFLGSGILFVLAFQMLEI